MIRQLVGKAGNSCRRVGLGVAMLLGMPVCAAPLFTRIGDSPSPTWPVINNHGLVAYSTQHGLGNNTSGVFEGTGGAVTTVAVGVVPPVWGIAINDSGRIAFQAIVSPSSSFQTFSGVPGSRTAIVPGTGGLAGQPFAEPGAIDDSGVVTGVQANNGQVSGPVGTDVVSGTGGPLTTIVSTTTDFSSSYSALFGSVSAAHNGALAYQWFSAFSNSEVRTIVGGVQHTVLTITGGSLNSIAINNSGVVAISGVTALNGPAGLFLASPSGVTTLIDTKSGVYKNVNVASINNLGQIAFTGLATQNGIYTGTDPVADKLIAVGDALDGSTVKALDLSNQAINDAGQITFWASLNNGTAGVYTATPTPEPGAMGFLVAVGLLMSRRGRRVITSAGKL